MGSIERLGSTVSFSSVEVLKLTKEVGGEKKLRECVGRGANGRER